MCHLTEGDMGHRSTCDAPLLRWCLCYCLAGVFSCIALASLPSLCWGLCPCCAVIFVLLVLAGVSTVVALAFGIVTLIAMASLPLLHWHLCRSFALASITLIALASSPSFCLHCHPKPTLLWCLFHCSTGVVTIVVLFVLINSISMLKHFVYV